MKHSIGLLAIFVTLSACGAVAMAQQPKKVTRIGYLSSQDPAHESARAEGNAAMRIGQDHVAATVNTLVLAYAGASLPMLLMFSLGRGDFGYVVNFSFIAEEIVRTLVGSLGLVAAVPLTTAIAAGFALYSPRLEKMGAGARSGGKRRRSSSLNPKPCEG